MFADMAAYAKAVSAVSGSEDMQKLIAENTKAGAALLERELLMGADI